MLLSFLWEQWKDSIVPIVLSIKQKAFHLNQVEGWEDKAFHFFAISEKNQPFSYCAIGHLTELIHFFSPHNISFYHPESLSSSKSRFPDQADIIVTRFCIAPELKGSGFHRYFATRTLFQTFYSFSPFIQIHCFIRNTSRLFPYLKRIGFEVLKHDLTFRFAQEKRTGYWLVLNPLNHFYKLVKEHYYNYQIIQDHGIFVDEKNESPYFTTVQLPSSLIPDKPLTLNQLLNTLTMKINSLRKTNPEFLHQLAYKHDLPEYLYSHYFFQNNHESDKEIAFLFLGREILRQLIKASSPHER